MAVALRAGSLGRTGEFVDMEEFVVQDLQLGGGSEISLLNLRMESPSLLDSIGADMMTQAGASNAASALQLVAGATVQEGKYAVVRGLPDRYVNSQLNGVRLPTADAEKRAVQLDQFPAPLVESIQVSKTFTPDQQGDASGGAVNVVTKGIPQEAVFQVSGQISYNTQVTGRSDFLTYRGGGVSFWGMDDRRRDIQYGNFGHNWTGAAAGPARHGDRHAGDLRGPGAGGRRREDDGISGQRHLRSPGDYRNRFGDRVAGALFSISTLSPTRSIQSLPGPARAGPNPRLGSSDAC